MGEGWDVSWNRIFGNVLFHLDQEGRSILDCDVEIFVIEGGLAQFDRVGIFGVRQELCQEYENVTKFLHKNKMQMG
jgi:hypothetical protein